MDVAVAAATDPLLPLARSLAYDLNLTMQEDSPISPTHLLVVTPHGLELRCQDGRREKPIFIDWLDGELSYRCRQGGVERLARAVGRGRGGRPTLLDATAGMGRDAFVMACLGYTVTMMERHPVMVALLQDGLQRAATHPEWTSLCQQLHFIPGDAAVYMVESHNRHDVVYLDPMFPEQPRKAAQKKEMRHLRSLLGTDEDSPRLLAAALAHARQRVVVKRPQWAAPLMGPSPSLTMTGSSTRFDIYLLTS